MAEWIGLLRHDKEALTGTHIRLDVDQISSVDITNYTDPDGKYHHFATVTMVDGQRASTHDSDSLKRLHRLVGA